VWQGAKIFTDNLQGIWTELAIAYGIHKTVVIFLRVPLAVALTPKVAKILRGWGYKVGRQKKN